MIKIINTFYRSSVINITQNSRYKSRINSGFSRYCPWAVQAEGVHRFGLVFFNYQKDLYNLLWNQA